MAFLGWKQVESLLGQGAVLLPHTSVGLCYELCAGIMDKAGKTPAQVSSQCGKSLLHMLVRLAAQQTPARFSRHALGTLWLAHPLCVCCALPACARVQVCCEEVLEEVGYRLQPHQLTPISSVVSSAGITGSQQAMFFAQVSCGWVVSPVGCSDRTHTFLLAVPLELVSTVCNGECLYACMHACMGV